ncbi:hypothetical protein AT15_06910 [Kosmotoga arenicorallina S304]|uniref:DUF4139 domain-containing protein n=1 Tax=Kosmotoga arenicorallina S304 TaxID=1453497 RepID=A0A182C6Z2_9BACT|nr:hypothetical protein [Kosmotoga arenicorallina]OAA31221.1 hypothetical protein AT15_06910 [Kosmotoga arenicorallina S304]
MKKAILMLVVFLLLVSVLLAKERLFIFSNFVVLVGEATPSTETFVVKAPLNARLDWQNFLATGLPESTQITFEERDNLETLYEKNLGKRIRFRFSWGEERELYVVSTIPVLKDVETGAIYYKPEGYAIFPETEFISEDSFVFHFPVAPESKVFYTYVITNGEWNASYMIRFDEVSMITGYMSINLEFDPGKRESYVVAADIPEPGINMAQLVRGLYKTEAMDFAAQPEAQSPDFIFYQLPVNPVEGGSKVAFLSKEISPVKRYVYRPRFLGSFTGVSIDYEIENLPFDLPAGAVQLYDGDRYSGYTSINTHVKGETLNLINVAKSLELTAKSKEGIIERTYKSLKYQRVYVLKNAGSESKEVEISDVLPVGASKVSLYVDGEKEKLEIAEEGDFEVKIIVPGKDEVTVTVEYSVPKNY